MNGCFAASDAGRFRSRFFATKGSVGVCVGLMEIKLERRELRRRHALMISRGRFATTENLFVRVAHEGLEGLGEAAAVDHGHLMQTAASSEASLHGLATELASLSPGRVQRVEALGRERDIGSAALAALDMACWDWLARRAGLPLFTLLGLEQGGPPTSITVGIECPQRVGELVSEVLGRTGARVIKLKLGGEGGIEADKERFIAAQDAAPGDVKVRVDANGGWTPPDAVEMIAWLHDRGCEYVEQPLPQAASIDELHHVYQRRRLPVLLDEPIFGAADVARLAPYCDGVNIKLMKSGGLSEAMRAIHTARAHGLSTMLGCFGESSVSISAAAALCSLLDHVDLDSNLNLDPDPAEGAAILDGRLLPPSSPGHGARLRELEP